MFLDLLSSVLYLKLKLIYLKLYILMADPVSVYPEQLFAIPVMAKFVFAQRSRLVRDNYPTDPFRSLQLQRKLYDASEL